MNLEKQENELWEIGVSKIQWRAFYHSDFHYNFEILIFFWIWIFFSFDFKRLRRLSTKYRTEKIYPTATGEKEENVKKNRYKDILPCKFKMPLKEQMDMLISSFIA